MALVGDVLYVANTDAVVKVPYSPGDTAIDVPPAMVLELPAGPRNHHWTKNIIASPDGREAVHRDRIEQQRRRARSRRGARARRALGVRPRRTGTHRTFATGLRNPVGMAWEPITGALWVAVNERDELGHDLVPDYMTAVKDGGFYGWPFSYFGANLDDRVDTGAARPWPAARSCPTTRSARTPPRWGWPSAPATASAPQWQQGMFVGQHGSWNRTPRSGYKVIFVPFESGRPSGLPRDVLTGFVTEQRRRDGPPGRCRRRQPRRPAGRRRRRQRGVARHRRGPHHLPLNLRVRPVRLRQAGAPAESTVSGVAARAV